MGVASRPLILLGLLMGLGRLGGCSCGRLGGWLVLWFPACVVGAGVVGCLVFGVEDTPAVVGCCGCCGRGGLLVVGVPVRACVRVGVACCRGSGVVRPGCLACGSASLLWGGVVGVGGLVVNCIVDASIITVCFCDCGMRAFCLCVLSCFVVCFFERSVDALASGADEGRGGLR